METNCLATPQLIADFDRWVQWIWESYFVFNFWKFKIKIYVGVDAIVVSILNFDTLCSISSLLSSFMMVPTILLFFRDFFWKSGLLEYHDWIRPYVRGHWFGCSLRPGSQLNSPCQEVGFICPFVVIDPTNLGATAAVALELLLVNFLPIPDAESLPIYPSVLKLVACVYSCG